MAADKERDGSVNIIYLDKKKAPEPPPDEEINIPEPPKLFALGLERLIDRGHILSKMSRQIAEQTYLPVSTVMMAGLATFSGMACRRYCVAYPNGFRLPIGLYVIAEQPPGTGKSRCLKTFQLPFFKLREASIEKIDRQLARYDELVSSGEKMNSGEAADYKKLTDRRRAINAALYVSNSTPEGIEISLQANAGFFAAASSEKGILTSLIGSMYAGTRQSNNNDVVLSGFDGGNISSLRVSRDGYSGYVAGAICCFAQAGAYTIVSSESSDCGLAERFLILAEPHSIGRRNFVAMPKYWKEIDEEYEEICQFAGPIIEEPSGFLDLEVIDITDSGWTEIRQYQQRLENRLGEGGDYEHPMMRGFCSKIDMQIMKIAANLHIMRGKPEWPISISDIKSAIAIADELAQVVYRYLCIGGGTGRDAEFSAILSLFDEHNEPRTERNIIRRKIDRDPFKSYEGISKSERIRETIQLMVDCGMLERVPLGNVNYYRSR